MSGTYHEISEDRREEFFQKGYHKRNFFPHRLYYLPKCGPDALKLSERMCNEKEVNSQWEVLLHAASPAIDEFPDDLFFDNDLIWHQQQIGNTGHMAFAYLVLKGADLYGLNYVSDLVQRISRRREYKTRVEKVFQGWIHMLLNAILNFALVNRVKTIHSPTADLALQHTDRTRIVQRELFERAYDRAVNKYFRAERKGNWWVIDVQEHKEKIVIPLKVNNSSGPHKMICLCHDVERGVGHTATDPDFAKRADGESLANLAEMLSIEHKCGIKATYNVVGCFFDQCRKSIEADGHCLGFHSYDHRIEVGPLHTILKNKTIKGLIGKIKNRPFHRRGGQLHQCRKVDYRIKGYRPPQSRLTAELSDDNLCFFNFEWLATSASSLGFKNPVLENRVVKIPIAFDDFAMYKSTTPYEEWERKAIRSIHENQFVAFSLHDCYGHYWLPRYESFLQKIGGLAKMATLNEVSNQVILSNSR